MAPEGLKSDGRLEPSRCANNGGDYDNGYDERGDHEGVGEVLRDRNTVQVHETVRRKAVVSARVKPWLGRRRHEESDALFFSAPAVFACLAVRAFFRGLRIEIGREVG